MIGRWFQLFKFWLRVRRANKELLREVAKHQADPPYAPPTREEVLAFIHKGTVGPLSIGPQRFRHAMSYEPKRPYYTFPKE